MMTELKQPFAEGLRELVSPEWMAVWNRYKELEATLERVHTIASAHPKDKAILAAIKGEGDGK